MNISRYWLLDQEGKRFRKATIPEFVRAMRFNRTVSVNGNIYYLCLPSNIFSSLPSKNL